MSEKQLDELRSKAEKPLNKLETHREAIGQPEISDFKQLIHVNTELSEQQAEELINRLIKENAIGLNDQKIVEIDRSQLFSSEETNQALMQISFDHTIFRDSDTQKEIAQNYADYLIDKANIIPVWIDGATIFYRYNPASHVWNQVDFKMIRKKAKKDLGSEYSKKMKQEIKNQLTDHFNYVNFDEMGLEENQVLMKNGKVLNLETLETRKVRQEDYALNCVNAKFDEEASSDQLLQFIERTLDTEDMVKTFQEFLGYTLKWPDDSFEKMLLILGNTDTGKSTLLQVVEELFAESNTTKLSFPQIGMERAFHIKDLKDSVLNIDSDMDDQSIKRKSRVKKVLSKEPIFVEPKGKSGFTMKPQANFLVTSNDAPDDAGAEDAYYNRFLTLTATSRVPEEKKDRELVDKLTTEQELNWLLTWSIKGLKRLEEQNRFTCNRTEYETKEIWDRFGNSVQQFISEQVTIDREDGKNVPTSDLYETYQLWCETQIEQEVSQQKFIAQAAAHPDMVKRKADTVSGARRSCFINLKLKDYAV